MSDNAEPQAAGETAVPPQAVRVITVEKRAMRQTLDYVGTIRATQQVALSAQLPGTLTSLHVDRGDRVTRGQLLARIDANDIAARRAQIAAEIQRARTENDYLCGRYATDQNLAEAGVIHSAQLDTSRNACESSAQAVAATEAKRGELEATLNKGVIHSPIDGYVLERSAEPGEDVGPGRPLLMLASDGLEVLVPVVESDLRRGIKPGTPALVSLSTSSEFEGQVDTIAPSARGAARSAEVTVALPENTTELRPGMSADVSFVLAALPDATPVPREALKATDEGWAIFIIENDIARRVDIERGIAQGGLIAVEPRLASGTKVAVSNLDALDEGARVYPVDAKGGQR
ncbi:efflux RND transporter periplasmic adaptor subunit [Lujinxingia vulgaris]|nr:efflux RND transporter periplasmic adaptor subunit [Lujinxingia vulgaris]